MCVVPKTGSSTMKSAMLYLQRNVDKANIDKVASPRLYLQTGISTLNRLPKTEALKRLLNYTTFVVMRDPTARIVSAHSSKFTNRTTSTYFKLSYGLQIAMQQAKLFSKGVNLNDRNIVATSNLKMDPDFQRLSTDEQQEVIDYARIMRFGNISFHQFARFVSQKNPSRTMLLEPHWRPQVDLYTIHLLLRT
ncbi:carbohydrate sulfotransferase 11-like isoform X2 [Clavelina lepadiformis]|uniref:carbohydrate sulfotransferase 11-like isoform X2 n=1 Tax=Clavelina lepadiformis TaxID=159417 RepID=UPI004041E2F9